MGSSVVSPEDVLESLMLDGTVDAIRLKIINQLKTNEELRNNTITMVEESRVLSTPGAEKQTKRELFEALRAELETQALEMASKAVWELILDNDGLGKDINETVEKVFCRLNGGKVPPFPMHPPQHQPPMPPPPPPPQQSHPPTLLHHFSQQPPPPPPLPPLLQQLLQQQHGALPPPYQPLAQLQHPPLAPLPQLPLQHFPLQQPPIPPPMQHPPLAPLPQLPLHRLPQQQHPPPPLHQLPQQQLPLLPPQPPLPPQLQEQPPPPPPSPPPPQPPPPPPSPPSPMQLSPLPQSLEFLPADVQIENGNNSEEREEGEKVDDIKMIESFNESNMQVAGTEIRTVTPSETEMPSMDL